MLCAPQDSQQLVVKGVGATKLKPRPSETLDGIFRHPLI